MNEVVPQNIEAEMSLLGCLLMDKDLKHQVSLLPEYFYYQKHSLIFSVIKELDTADLLTVSARLEEKGELKQVGGRTYLASLINTIITTTNFEKYAEIIKDKWVRREMIKQMSDNLKNLYDEEKQTAQVINDIKAGVLKTETTKKYKVETNPNLTDDWINEYDKPIDFTKFGMPILDVGIGGLTSTDLALIIAGTNLGKTTLLLNMAIAMMKKGKKILFYSLEMSSRQLMNKLISIYGKFNAFNISQGVVMKDSIILTAKEFSQFPITIVHQGIITSQDVITETYNRKLRGQVDIVMLDYVQRLSDQSKENEVIRLGTIARNLKNFALANEIPIITPAQVDKDSSKSGKIAVENVAWAKALADEADIALYLYEKEIKDKTRGITENWNIEKELRLQVVKARHAKKGLDMKIYFDPISLRMRDSELETEEVVDQVEKDFNEPQY